MAKAPTVTRNEIALSNGIRIEKTSITGADDMFLLSHLDGSMHPLTSDDIEQLKSITSKVKTVTRKAVATATQTSGDGQRKRYDLTSKLAILKEIDDANASGSSQAAILRQINYPSANTVSLWRKHADIIAARG